MTHTFQSIIAEHPYGFFADPVTLRPLPADEPAVVAAWLVDPRLVRVEKDIAFVDPGGVVWRVYAGATEQPEFMGIRR